jgi:O-antigen ligase
MLAVAAPFERPIGAVPGLPFLITTVEAAILSAWLIVVVSWAVERRTFVWRTPITWPGLALIAALAVAAACAPAFQGNAFRFTARVLAAATIVLVTANAASTAAAARRIAGVFVIVAAFVGAVAVLEAAETPFVMEGLKLFRPGFHVVGGQLRATSTLGYPTTASMYLEVAFALGLWLYAEAIDRRARGRSALVFLALVLIGAGIVSTFTRAGLLGIVAALLVFAGLRFHRTRAADRVHAGLLILALVLSATVLVSRSPARLLTRLTTEGSQAWYGAEYEVPASLRLVPGGRYRVPVAVTNTGRIAWRSDETPPFALSYHWVVAGSGRVAEFNGRRTLFTAEVPPGGRTRLRALVVAPPAPGWFELVWDVVHEHRAWLSTEGVRAARTAVRVDGPIARAPGDAMAALPATAIRPDRLTLWHTAVRMAAAHPFTGVGPDNFRLAYGSYAGIDDWDTRVHANNLYLEVLSGAGVPGLAALGWLVLAAVLSLWRRWRAASAFDASAGAAALAVLVVVLGHGLVDTFLAFTPTYVTFALAAGLAFSPVPNPPSDGHADCV